MCGIAGMLLRHDKADAAVVKAMCDRIRHRGPDDEGYHLDGGCGIGMRRLSIVDLSTGHQPICNEDESVWVVFNGEIYNYRELRDWLIGKGHRFRTESDTEVLVHLYEEEAEQGIARLRGMFAYAIWDARKRRVMLGRDRFGKKPLYYSIGPEGLHFGSELKCLTEAGIGGDADPDALRLYFQFGHIPEPYSCYRSVRKLESGGWLTYDLDGNIQRGRYWRLPPPEERETINFTEAQACDRLRDLFDESVRLRMIADVPLGAFLSGGIDSSLVVASMAMQSKEPVQTFSIGFEEAAFNELPYAAVVAQRYKTDHHEITVRPNSVELVQKLVQHFDEPFADASAIPTYIVSEFARRYVKVALSGDGGDELFAGYERFQLAQDLAKWDSVPGLALGGTLAKLLPYATYGKNYLYGISRPTAFDRFLQFSSAPYLLQRQLLDGGGIEPADAAFIAAALPDCLLSHASPLSRAMYFEATANLTGDILVKVDRMSMAASLEVRCPLLDHQFAEFAQRIPNSWKLIGGRGKQILLKALGDRLPPELLNRPKMGFGVPLAAWFRGPLRDMIHDCLLSPKLAGRGIVSPKFVRHLIDEHESGRRDNHTWLWSLLMLELWFRESERGATKSPAPAQVV